MCVFSLGKRTLVKDRVEICLFCLNKKEGKEVIRGTERLLQCENVLLLQLKNC